MRLILASRSPRRRELLALLGLPFETADPAISETIVPGVPPSEQAARLAREKARACVRDDAEALVIAGDTLIAVDDAIVGQPADRGEAVQMLERLRGRRHMIHSAVAVGTAGGLFDVGVDVVEVWMLAYSDAEIAAYVATGEGLDKAGAYAIQGGGAALIERIAGDFTAAVGLPLRRVAMLLERRGVRIPVDVADLYRRRPVSNWPRFAPPLL